MQIALSILGGAVWGLLAALLNATLMKRAVAKNDIKSVTVVRMEVPCCGGLEHAAKTALQNSGKFIPWQVVTISTDGRILDTI